jgi:hypothetical protein
MDVQMDIIPGAELSPGAYRLEVEFGLEEGARRWTAASLGEGMLLVY